MVPERAREGAVEEARAWFDGRLERYPSVLVCVIIAGVQHAFGAGVKPVRSQDRRLVAEFIRKRTHLVRDL